MPSDTRVNPASRMPAKNSGDVDSGLDSVVTSASAARPTVSRTADSTSARPVAPSSDGVPPPTNTVSAAGGDPRTDAAMASSPRRPSSQDCGDAGDDASSAAVYVLKSQYPQRVAQNGTCTYTPNGRCPRPRSADSGNLPSVGATSPSGSADGTCSSVGHSAQRNTTRVTTVRPAARIRNTNPYTGALRHQCVCRSSANRPGPVNSSANAAAA